MDLLAQHEAFLRAIFDAPDDDTPRLVYADFLQENGEEDRAELIRVQCELARQRTGGRAGRDRVIELDIRQAELTRRLGTSEADTDRGFETFDGIARVHTGLLKMRQKLREWLVKQRPYYFGATAIGLTGGVIQSKEQIDTIFEHPAFVGVKSLCLRGWIKYELPSPEKAAVTPAGLRFLALHPAARRLTHLDLYGNDFRDAGGEVLIESPYLTGLQRLSVGENNLSDAMRQRLRERFSQAVL